jgi:predicted MFS family arabinose efflux permease
MNDGSRDLERLQQQRTALAQRLRLPWWYLAATAVLMAVLLGLPFLQPRYVSDDAGQVSSLVLVLIQFGLSRLLENTTGVKYRGRNMYYPSARPVMWVTCAVAAASVAGEGALLRSGDTVLAVTVVVVTVAAVVGILLWQNAAIRLDIRQGRAVSR